MEVKKVYADQDRKESISVLTNIVEQINFAEHLLGQEETVVSNNYCTSLELAEKLVKNIFIGDFERNRKELSKYGVNKKKQKNKKI